MERKGIRMNLLEVKGVYKSYQDFQMKDITFSLPKGYIMGYIGQNGAGKTTTINIIASLCKADKGEIIIDGLKYQDNPTLYKESIGYVGDEFYFPKEFKIKEVKSILRKFYQSFQEDTFQAYITKWGLPENKKIGEFSRGMKVKLMFASILARETKLLILDEATNGLDPVMREEILGILQAYIEDGEKSILFSTHVLNDLDQIADYIVFIDNGTILLKEPKDELLEHFLLIKGEEADLTPKQNKHLIGKTKQRYSFEAIIEADVAGEFGSRFVFDKPSIDQIMLHFVKDGGKYHVCN